MMATDGSGAEGEDLKAARLLLARLGVTPEQLLTVKAHPVRCLRSLST